MSNHVLDLGAVFDCTDFRLAMPRGSEEDE